MLWLSFVKNVLPQALYSFLITKWLSMVEEGPGCLPGTLCLTTIFLIQVQLTI